MAKKANALKSWFRLAGPGLQVELARSLKVHPSLISHWVAGRRKPGRKQLIGIALYTGIEIKDLL